jgi:hypothetical protein
MAQAVVEPVLQAGRFRQVDELAFDLDTLVGHLGRGDVPDRLVAVVLPQQRNGQFELRALGLDDVADPVAVGVVAMPVISALGPRPWLLTVRMLYAIFLSME